MAPKRARTPSGDAKVSAAAAAAKASSKESAAKKPKVASGSAAAPKSSTTTTTTTTTTNGSVAGTKRKARASTAEPSASVDKAAPKLKAQRRTRTPGPLDNKKAQVPVYTVRTGINPLPAPLLPVTRTLLDKNLAVDVSTPYMAPTARERQAQIESAAGKAGAGAGGVLKRDLFVFGNGDMGQHGLGTDVLDEIKRPRLHSWVASKNAEDALGAGGIEMVAAGGMHSLLIDSNGRVLSYGINDNGCLGRRTTRDPSIEAEVFETEPIAIEGLSPTGRGVVGGPSLEGGKEGDVEQFRATRVAAGDSVSVAVSDRGEIRVWGSFRSNDGLLGFDGTVGSDKVQFLPVALPSLQKYSISAVCCGDDHVLALTTEGEVLTWGNGQQMQLGRRIIERRKINGLTPEKLSLKNIVLIGAGAYHSFAVNKDGKVFAWGLNSLKQTGIDTVEDIIPVPREVPALNPKELGASVVQIQAGQHHSLFLLSDGRVFGTGRCDGFELGIDESHPAMQEVQKAREAWGRKRDEELKVEIPAWEKRMEEKKKKAAAASAEAGGAGAGSNGMSLDMVMTEEDMPPKKGVPPDEYVAEPVHIPFPASARVVQLACGSRNNMAVTEDGTVYSWGFGISSQLGQGDEEQIETPTVVKSKQLAPFQTMAIAAGGQHSILLAVRSKEVAQP